MLRKPVPIVFGLVLLTLIGSSISCVRKIKAPPLVEAPSIESPAIAQFLGSGFLLIDDVRDLPPPVLQSFTEPGGSRLIIANPGEDFEDTDFITDRNRPRMRLIFAGVSSDDKCFVHYVHGGRGTSFRLDLFRVSSNHMEPVWKGYCLGPAANLEELRSWLATGRCHAPGLPLADVLR